MNPTASSSPAGLSLFLAGSLLLSGAASAQVLFYDDFNAADGTPLAGHVPQTGQAWTQTGGTALTIQGGGINTARADRTTYANFSQSYSGSPRLLAMTVDFTSMTFSGGWGGVSLFEGNNERIFLGSANNRGGSVSISIPGGPVGSAVPATPTGVVTMLYDSETGKTTLFAGASVFGQELLSVMAAPNLGMDRIRVANGGSDLGVSSIKVEALDQGPVSISKFGFDLPIGRVGYEPYLMWRADFADTVTITPGPGNVASSGDEMITPPLGDTVYQITATSGTSSRQASARVRYVVGGTVQYRYLRYVTRKTRNSQPATQLSELNFFHNGVEVVPLSVANPGNSVPAEFEDANKVFDGLNNTKWLDYAGAPLIFDFGATPPEIDSYSFVSANDNPERDPLNWTFEGSNDGTNWTLVENVTAFDFPFTTNRNSESLSIPFPGVSLFPLADLRANASTLVAGDPLTVRYDVTGSQSAVLSDGTTNTPLTGTSGVLTLNPSASVTYTLTSTAATGIVSTRTLPVTVINPAITNIAYTNFENASNELSLVGTSQIVNDFALRPQPGDFKRLRLTADINGQSGSAWFRKRQKVNTGFETSFNMQISRTDSGTGADGIAFVVQNAPEGNNLSIVNVHNTQAKNALVVAFDTYGGGGASLYIGGNGTRLTQISNLAVIPGLTLRGGNRLQDPTGKGAPYLVQISYLPNSLTVRLDGVVVLDRYAVNLEALNAVDASGTAVVGFAAATGGLSEAHDVTSWTLTTAETPAAPLRVISSSFNVPGTQGTLTWQSTAGKTYRITTSTDLADWSQTVATGVAATGAQTSSTFSFTAPAGGKRFFRVEEQ